MQIIAKWPAFVGRMCALECGPQSKWKWVARVTVNTWSLISPECWNQGPTKLLRVASSNFCRSKTMFLSVTVSTLGPFRITSSDAAHSQPFWNCETLTRFDFLVFQKLVWKISLGTASERMPRCLLPTVLRETGQPPVTVSSLLSPWPATV